MLPWCYNDARPSKTDYMGLNVKKFSSLDRRKNKRNNLYKDHVVAAVIKIHAHMTYLSDDMSMLVARISWVPYAGFFSLTNTICGV